MELEAAIKVLRDAGVVFSLPPVISRSLTLEQVAERIGFGRAWVIGHLAEFPGAWRAPGGGRNGGELRIPERDVTAFEHRRRVFRD